MTPRRSQPIADAELAVLRALWGGGAATVRELMGRLAADDGDRPPREWAYTTVQTLLQRLCDKGFARVDKRAAAHRFAAAVTREQLAGDRAQDLVDEVLDGAVTPLLLGLLPKARFTSDEIARFRALLDRVDVERPDVEGPDGGGDAAAAAARAAAAKARRKHRRRRGGDGGGA